MASKSLGTLTLDLIAKVGGFTSGLNQAERSSAKWRQQVERDAKAASDKQAAAFSAITTQVTKMAGVVGIALSTGQLISYADTWTELSDRVKGSIAPGEDANEVLRSISATARSTYSSLNQTAESFLSNATALTELGYSTKQQLDLSDALNNALVVSGTRGQQAESVMNALSKAMALGKLSGDNWNTVLQSGGRIVTALSDSIGITTLELRKMASDGLLTTETVVQSLISQMGKLREESGAMAATVGDGVTLMGNAMLELVGTLDQATGASGILSIAIIAVADAIRPFDDTGNLKAWAENLDVVADAASLLAIAVGSRLVAASAAATTSFIAGQIEALKYQAALARMAGVANTTAVSITALSAASRAASAAMAFLGGPVGAITLAVGALAYFTLGSSSAEKASAALEERVSKLGDSFDGLTVAQARAAILDYDDLLKKATETMKIAEARSETLRVQIERHPSGKNVKQWKDELVRADAAIDDARAEVEKLNSSVERLNALANGGAGQALATGANVASEAFQKLNRQMLEQLAIIGMTTEAQKLAARIEGGFVEGISDDEGKVLVELQKEIDLKTAKVRADEEAARASQKASKSSSSASASRSNIIQDEINSLQKVIDTWDMTATQVRLHDLALQGATQSQLAHAGALAETIAGLEKQKEINAEATSIAESLRTEEEEILASYERRREIILENTQITGEEQTELLRRLEEERNQGLLELNGSYWEKWLEGAAISLESFDELAGSVVDQFTNNVGSAFEKMVFDSESFGDALSGLAEGMARSIVAALGKMAAQWLVYQAVQLVVGKTTQATAASALTANATAASLLAGINAYASAAAIPIVGFALAPVAMAAALATTAPLAAAVGTAALAGMAHEGIDSVPETGTWLLEKGERVTTAETSAKLDRTLEEVNRGKSSGNGVTVNVIEDKSRAGEVETETGTNEDEVINIFVSNIRNGGSAARAIESTYAIRRQGR